ncbi:MAG: Ig domain-containing protein, partial [Patescibacteria group bacterium]
KITGTPNVPAGDYDFTAAARDEFYDQTISPYSAETTRTFTLTVANESFIVNPIPDSTIYTYPAPFVYYGPVQFNATASVTTPTPVTYSLFNNPAWLTINPATGAIQGTPTDNVNDPGDKNVIVRATTNNGCNVMASSNFTIHVLANSWCGDGVTNGGEQCDGAGTGTSINNQWGCTSCHWTGGWCGDGVINGSEHCDGSNLNGATCVGLGWSGGSLSCNSSCQPNTASCQYTYYEVPAAREHYSSLAIGVGTISSAYWNMNMYGSTFTTGWCAIMQSFNQISSTPNSSTFITHTNYGPSFRAVWSWGNCAGYAGGVCSGCDYIGDVWIYKYQR